MRIGTWNLDARWDQRHARLVAEQACDVWLLTEIPDAFDLPGFRGQTTKARMRRGQRWAGVFATNLIAKPDPEVATAAAEWGEVTLWSSVLPWPACGPSPWAGDRHDERIRAALDDLLDARPAGDLVWGGDWNHTLRGRSVGSRTGRVAILDAVEALGLQVPTAALPHRLEGVHSIDHIALPVRWQVRSADRVRAQVDGRRLSDHDLYVIDVDAPPGSPSH